MRKRSGCRSIGSRVALAVVIVLLCTSCTAVRTPDQDKLRPVGTSGDLCASGARLGLTFDQAFHNDRWQRSRGGRWSTQYPWGRANPGAKDAAYYADGDWGPELDPFAIAHGDTLVITARRVPERLQPRADGHVFVSGMISTAGPGQPTFEGRYGYYEVAARLPKGRGIWPAFWMLDRAGGRSEIDVFELLGGDISTVYQSVHRVDGTGASYPYHLTFDPTAGFHRYGMLVTPLRDTYYVDGSPTHHIADASTGPYSFMISLQIGEPDSWPGAPTESTVWPVNLELRYFRAYLATTEPC